MTSNSVKETYCKLMLLGSSENFKYMTKGECLQVDVYRTAKHIKENMNQLKNKDLAILLKGLGITYLVQVKTLSAET